MKGNINNIMDRQPVIALSVTMVAYNKAHTCI